MQNVVVGLLLLGCTLPAAAGAMKIASSFSEVTAPHQFPHLNSEPLWTSEVRRIDTNKQAFERIPGQYAPDALLADAAPAEASGGSVKLISDETNIASENTEDSTIGDLSPGRLAEEWCAQRYRSYDPADNSYQPYGGGPRKSCTAPDELLSMTVQAANSMPPGEYSEDHTRWCMSRYSSYRVEDNSYQPFSGGGRKQCLSPDIASAKAQSDGRIVALENRGG